MRPLTDNPVTAPQDDSFHFGPYVDVLHAAVEQAAPLPLTVGVFGSWGAGKSSFLRLWERRFEAEPHPDDLVQPLEVRPQGRGLGRAAAHRPRGDGAGADPPGQGRPARQGRDLALDPRSAWAPRRRSAPAASSGARTSTTCSRACPRATRSSTGR
ncbi:P-loop NTPase fold protein [Streptomyces lasalocidi]